MPEITALLDRTTPDELPPLDLPALAARARTRTHRRRAAAVVAAGVVPVLAVAAVAVTRPDADDDRDAFAYSGPLELSEPVGTWQPAAAPPVDWPGPVFADALSDGRVLVWGNDPFSEHQDVPQRDGAIYDPEADRWTALPAAPLPPPGPGGPGLIEVRLTDDRLAVVADAGDGSLDAAVYDVATGRWTASPPLHDMPIVHDGLAWDGETLALVRLQAGEVGHTDDPGLDWRVTEPLTRRWSPGDDRWSDGAPPPLGLRFGAGSAADGDRLAVWGGTTSPTNPPQPGPDPGLRTDGAIYDVAADTWTAMAPSPLPGRIHPALVWHGGRLVVGGGVDRLVDGDFLSTAATYHPTAGVWEPVAAAPTGGPARLRDGFVVSRSRDGTSGPQPIWFVTDAGWEQAPLNDLHRMAGLVVATSASPDNPGGDRFDVDVRVDRDVWLDTADAPFTNRMDAAVVVTGTKLLVVGGVEGPSLDRTAQAWVFDIAGGTSGTGGEGAP